MPWPEPDPFGSSLWPERPEASDGGLAEGEEAFVGLAGPSEPIHRLLGVALLGVFVCRLHMSGVGEAELADGGLAGFGGHMVVHCEDTLPKTPTSVEIYFQLFSRATIVYHAYAPASTAPKGGPMAITSW